MHDTSDLLYLDDVNDDPASEHHFYSLKDQEVFQQDAVPPLFEEGVGATPGRPDQYNKETSACSSIPIHKKIPKIALNFTKWKLQKRMVDDLRKITDPEEIQS